MTYVTNEVKAAPAPEQIRRRELHWNALAAQEREAVQRFLDEAQADVAQAQVPPRAQVFLRRHHSC